MKKLIMAVALLVTQSAFSDDGILVKCVTTGPGPVSSLVAKLSNNGKFTLIDGVRYIKANKKSIFVGMTDPLEDSGYEWEHNFKAPNGYSILELGTTADSMTLGIKLSSGSGFFKYRDLGSGNGNSQQVLSCAKY